MSVAKLVAFLRALPDEQRQDMIERMQPQEQEMVRALLASAQDSSASVVEEVAKELGTGAPARR